MSKRNQMKYITILFLFIISLSIKAESTSAKQNPIGTWTTDSYQLPCFNYTGKLPYKQVLPNGDKVNLPEDPFFLLGNYRFKLFAHVSGEYELLSGERSYARLNFDKKLNSNVSGAYLIQNKDTIKLTGIFSLAANPDITTRNIGVGTAVYNYKVNENLAIKRYFSVKPSQKPNEGTPAFLIDIEFKNNSKKIQKFKYNEYVGVNFMPCIDQIAPESERLVKYNNIIKYDNARKTVQAVMQAKADDPFLIVSHDEPNRFDGFPPVVFVKVMNDALCKWNFKDEKLPFRGDKLTTVFEIELKPGEIRHLQLCVGYIHTAEVTENIEKIADEFGKKTITNTIEKDEIVNVFGNEWKSKLPDFQEESNPIFKREMTWNAYVLQAMSTFSEYYGETYIPQGSGYDFQIGFVSVPRDHLQGTLPLAYLDPALCKSALRWVMQKIAKSGEMKWGEVGYAQTTNFHWMSSDMQLYFLLALSNYLEVTGDTNFLLEEIPYYPKSTNFKWSVIEQIESVFMYIKNETQLGGHGLIKLRGGDWNDAFYYQRPLANYWWGAESHLNSAIALVAMDRLIPILENAAKNTSVINKSPKLSNLIESIRIYRKNLLASYLKDWGVRPFPGRVYLAGESLKLGFDNMYVEPQGFTLQIQDIDKEKRKALMGEIENRLMRDEKVGARCIEAPHEYGESAKMYFAENGAMWYAMTGPLIEGAISIDKKIGEKWLQSITFDNISRQYPDYWAGYWSSTDCLNSSKDPSGGLMGSVRTGDFWLMPVYNVHPHAWALYCYYKLREKTNLKQ